MTLPHIMRTAAIASAVCCALAAFGARAEITLTPSGCQSYASWAGNLVWASGLGADKEKARADLVTHDEKAPSSIYALMLRELDQLWATQASWEDVTLVVLKDCVARRGRYESGD